MEAAAFSSKKKPPPAPPSAAVKGGGGGGYFGASYDDVFGGAPKFSASLAPRAEDYSEIFSGFRTTSSSSRAASSSIPVLDLPAVDGDELDAVFDYDVVFGGLNAVDFAVPFDELFRSSDGFDASDDDDAWTPVGTESFSDNSDPFAFSEKSQCSFNSISDQASESKQFNVSYHKVNPGTSTCMPDTIHVAQLNDFPGYTCVVEESTSLREMDKERSCSQAAKDKAHNTESPPTNKQKHVKKSLSHLSHEGGGLKSVNGDPSSGRGRSVSMSHINSTSDVNISTKASQFVKPSTESRPLPVPTERNTGIKGLSSVPKASENCGFKATVDGSLPPFFDMEVDASSSAAASAAAMKDVMDKAQAQLKAAREFRGRKDSFQNSGEVIPDTVVNGKSNVEMAHTERVSENKRVQANSDRGASKSKNSSKPRHGRHLSQVLPETLVDEPIDVNGQPSPKSCSLPLDTANTDTGGEWKEARQYFEFVSNDKSRSAYQPPTNGDGKNEASKQQYNNENDSDSAGESPVIQTNRPRLKAARAVSRQGYYEKMIKVAQEVHDTVTSEHTETKEEFQDVFNGEIKQQKRKLVVEPKNNECEVRDTHRAESEMKPKNVVENETMETSMTDGRYKEDLNGRSSNDPLLNMSKEVAYDNKVERRVKGTSERGESGGEAHKGFVDLTTEALQNRNFKGSRKANDAESKIASEHMFDGEKLQKSFVSKEKDRIEDVQKMSAEFGKPTDATKDTITKERLESGLGKENYVTTETQQVYEEHIQKTTNGHRPETMLDQNDVLEKCWEYLETAEQERSRLNMDNSDRPLDKSDSVKSQKNDEKVEKHEQTSEKINVHYQPKESDKELGESVDNDDKATFKENRNDAFKTQMETDGDDWVVEPDNAFDIELSANDKHRTFPNAVYPNGNHVELNAPKTPHLKANGSVEVSSGKENGEIDTTLLSDNKVKGFETADVQFDEEELRSTIPEVGISDEEPEGEAGPAPLERPQMKADVSVEMSAGKENGEIISVMSEETSSKAVEAANVIEEKQTTLPETHECPNDDEHKCRPIDASQTLQVNGKNTKVGEGLPRHDQYSTTQKVKIAEPVSEPKFAKTSYLERGGMTRNQGVGRVFCGEEEKTIPTQSESLNVSNEHSINNRGGAHPIMPDWKERVQRTSQVSSSHSQNISRNEKFISRNGSLEPKDQGKETDQENEHLRKLEEEREREREREKDKMAVEVAIREARERAYADARDRAERAALERATEEVRQRAMNEARERLEKACAEARERSVTNKASEARSRAERAAVERATAEARQRAFEKSMADRAMSETRERVQRSMSEKYTSERDVIMRQSSFPTTSERSDTGNGEPAERCKARLERHRRTVERVAKALEEKNQRDLLAQREQAERNRFAETLDADIKRWSSGKAGNLRALLSTLQYILGPDSGWQPIPLTEVITAAAVKKAYRKATLCVHPDKLQQRGASIQQKYISEKVFDLLKEAWNRFNSEEK